MSALGTPDCASQFGRAANSMNPSTLLADAVAGILTGTTTELTFGTENIKGTNPNTSELGITVLSNDAWAYLKNAGQGVESTRASININIASWNNETTIQRAQTLIHELGHVFDMLLGAGGSMFVQDSNPDGPNLASEAIMASWFRTVYTTKSTKVVASLFAVWLVSALSNEGIGATLFSKRQWQRSWQSRASSTGS